MTDTRERYSKACRAGAAAIEVMRKGSPAAVLLRQLGERMASPPRPVATPQESDFAKQKDEIARKALETLQDAQAKLDQGVYTERDLWVVANTLYDNVSGMVDWDIANLILAARQELQEHSPL